MIYTLLILPFLHQIKIKRPFSFDSNEKFEVEADRAYVKTKSKDEVHDEQKEDNLEAEIRKDFNINQSEERVHALSHQSYDENNGHNHDSFTFDDLKKEKPIKYHQSMEESHFIEGSDSDSGRSDSTDCMFETFNEKKDLSNTAASSRKLLSILSAKISKISERKPIAKYEDNVFVEKSDIQKNDGKTDISSLSYTLRGIPKLLDLHSARLKQGKTKFFFIYCCLQF